MKPNLSIESHHQSSERLTSYLYGILDPREATPLQQHLRLCRVCNGRCKRTRRRLEAEYRIYSAPRSRDRLVIDWMVLVNRLVTHPLGGSLHSHVLRLRFQGMDRTLALADLTAPIDDLALNIFSIQFYVFGLHHEFFNLDLEVEGPTETLCRLSHLFQARRLVYREGLSLLPSPGYQTIKRPYLVALKAGLPDEPGVTNRFCRLIGRETLVGFDRGSHKKDASSCPAAGSIVDFQARVVHDADFAGGGTPGFRIEARIATRTKRATDLIEDRLEGFRAQRDCGAFSVRRLGRTAFEVQFPTNHSIIYN